MRRCAKHFAAASDSSRCKVSSSAAQRLAVEGEGCGAALGKYRAGMIDRALMPIRYVHMTQNSTTPNRRPVRDDRGVKSLDSSALTAIEWLVTVPTPGVNPWPPPWHGLTPARAGPGREWDFVFHSTSL